MDENKDNGYDEINSKQNEDGGFNTEIGSDQTDFSYKGDQYTPESENNEVKSYTPPQEFGFMENYGYRTQNETIVSVPELKQDNQKGKKNKKEKKPPKKTTITIGTIVALALVCAIVSSVCTSIAFMYADGIGNIGTSVSSQATAASTDDTVKQINIVSTQTDSLIEAIAEKVSPSVVGIKTTTSVTYMFYGTTEQTGEGSGIIYSSDGYIITNYHVISDAVENQGTLSVYLPSDSETAITATVVGYDVSSDLAVIKIANTGLTPIEIGDSSQVKVGQTAVAIGNPGGLEFMGSVSAGIISGLNRTIQLENTSDYMNLIQTDAAINPGNSGGALVNSSGLLIGINSAKLASTDYEGMGFAIPSNSVVEICERIIKNVDEPKAYFGLEISEYYTSDRLQMMGYPSGVVVEAVTADGPADAAGLQRGDVITKINDTAVTSYALYNSEKSKYSPNQTVSVTIYREGSYHTVSITLGTANE